MTPILRVDHLCKRFGTLEVLRDINFEIGDGEVVGLVGLNGTGKSVIANILAGLYPPSSGAVFVDGNPLQWSSSTRRYGIDVIHQTPELVDTADITTNVFLGREISYSFLPRWLNIPDQARMEQETVKVLRFLGANIDSLREKVANLSGEQRQIVAIARAMVRSERIIIIDEPTALLGYVYQEKLLSLVHQWQREGKTVVFCSANLDHLFAVTDRILVLQNRDTIVSLRTDETNREEIVAAMVGQKATEEQTPAIWALDSYYRARKKVDMLYQQTSLLERDLAAQDSLNQQLLGQLSIQVKALDQANSALQDAQRRLLTERELERKHLSRELHDQVIQDLLSANYQLETIEGSHDPNSDRDEQVEDVRHTLRALIEDLRRICGNLRPPTIDSLGLAAAIQSYTNEWSRRTGIQVNLQIRIQSSRFPEEIELSIFRIIQEALHNVHHHSQGSQVDIGLQHISQRTLMLSIRDDGCGLPPDFDLSKLISQGHYGLIGVSERVALLSGHLRISNHEEGGMLLQVEIQHPRIEMNSSPIGKQVAYVDFSDL